MSSRDHVDVKVVIGMGKWEGCDSLAWKDPCRLGGLCTSFAQPVASCSVPACFPWGAGGCCLALSCLVSGRLIRHQVAGSRSCLSCLSPTDKRTDRGGKKADNDKAIRKSSSRNILSVFPRDTSAPIHIWRLNSSTTSTTTTTAKNNHRHHVCHWNPRLLRRLRQPAACVHGL